MFDQKTFVQFLETPQKDRDARWEDQLLNDFPQCKLTLISKAPQVGPDNFPYMFVEVTEASTEPALSLLYWISENGVGLAVNPKKTYPDFVFTFGMVWNFTRFGKFLENPVNDHVHGPGCKHDFEDGTHSDSNHSDEKPDTLKEGSTVYMGIPTDSFLPPVVRTTVKDFLKQQGVMAPKITMLSVDQVNFDLCFSIESFGTPEPTEHEGILQGLSWFLPAHYSLAMVSEKDLPPFEAL